MNAFMSKWLSKTQEPRYEIRVYRRKSLGFLRSFFVDGSLSIFNEKSTTALGEILTQDSYQFFCDQKIEDLLTAEERADYDNGLIDFWLKDRQGRFIHLQRKTDYRASTGIWKTFANVVYDGRIESTESPEEGEDG